MLGNQRMPQLERLREPEPVWLQEEDKEVNGWNWAPKPSGNRTGFSWGTGVSCMPPTMPLRRVRMGMAWVDPTCFSHHWASQ